MQYSPSDAESHAMKPMIGSVAKLDNFLVILIILTISDHFAARNVDCIETY